MFVTGGTADTTVSFEGIRYQAQFFAQLAGCDAFGTRTPVQPANCSKFKDCDRDLITFCELPGQVHAPLWARAAPDSWAWFNSLP